MKDNKPTRKELIRALEILAKWATGGDTDGNPYRHPEIKQALQVLARERGIKDYLSVNL